LSIKASELLLESFMPIRTAVIIATKGRPQELSKLLDVLALQTVPPDLTVISACDSRDIAPDHIAKNVQVLFGSPGLPAQRNRALAAVRGKCELVVFFDDDFIPSRFWIERVRDLISEQPDIVSVTGNVLLDGVTMGGLEWPQGQSLVNAKDDSAEKSLGGHRIRDRYSPYGCNMAFRAKSIEHLTFDERLVRYGWLEDRDFSFRAGPKMVWTDALWGVHLGTTRGRSSGLSFGYSQIVNPWYLAKKGSMQPLHAGQTILRALARNAVGSLFPNRTTDRRGRLKGNLIATWDILSGRWAPERATDL
jgi:glycosyltransferase involved in cell wall biosynthesis